MKKIKSFVCVLFCAIVAFNGAITSYASDNIGVSENPTYLSSSEIQLYSTSEPKTEWNLSTKGKYSFSGSAKNNGLYTNYYFTGVDKVKIYVKNNGSSNFIVDFCKKNLLNTTVDERTVYKNGYTTYTISSLSKSKKYFLYFVPPCSFEGYIVKA
jgi:hypothetical protein